MNGLSKTCAVALATLLFPLAAPASAQETGTTAKPNILVIMADDIGYWNISAYNRGMMGYRTPNIDRIAAEGALFTDYYGQQSCTAGRAAFISGQSPMRTGLLKVGLPGAKEGLSDKDPTIADLLKPLGYMTGQFGKNHLGDRNEFLPTAHGFDEFFGNLYHLNAEDEPEHPEYPKGTEFRMTFGPRGVLRCTASSANAPGDDPRFGAWGMQNCEDTGPLDKKRMETVDEEFLAATMDFIGRAHAADKPFFAWFNPSRMHIWTRLKPESQGKTGLVAFPILATVSHAAAAGLDPRVLETVRTHGGGRGLALRLSLGEARSALVAGTLLAFGRCVTELGIAIAVGGGLRMRTRTLPTLISLKTSSGEFGAGLAAGMILVLVACGAAAVALALTAGSRGRR